MPRSRSSLFEPLQIARHQRLHIGIRARGGDAFVFANLGTHVGRQRDPQSGQHARFSRSRTRRSCSGIRVALQKTDGDDFDAVLARAPSASATHRLLVERQQHLPRASMRSGTREAQAPRHERRRLVEKDVVLREAMLPADLDDIAEAFGGDRARFARLCAR